jgi:phosphate uptake regulator
MKRKVNRVGQNTLTVSLPSKWAERNKIKKGQELEVTEKDKTLIFTTGNIKVLEEKIIDLRDIDEYARRMLTVPYMHGYEQLKIYYKDKAMLRKIKNTLPFMMGFEMTMETDEYCIVKNIARGMESEFNAMLNRFFQIAGVMINEVRDILTRHDAEKSELIRDYELSADKIHIFCRRLLNLQGSQDYRNTTAVYYIMSMIEIATDAYGDINDFLESHEVALGKDFMNMYAYLSEEFQFFLDMYYCYDPSKLGGLRKIEARIDNAYFKGKFTKDEMLLVCFLMKVHTALHHASEELS